MKTAWFAFLFASPVAFALRGGVTPLEHSRGEEQEEEPVVLADRLLQFNTDAIFNTPGAPVRAPRTLPPVPQVQQRCEFLPNSFESQFIVEFEGDPDLVTETDIRRIEAYMAESYDSSSSGFCDQNFREIFNVTIVESTPIVLADKQNKRRLSAATKSPSKRKFSFRFYVVGTCRNCKKDSVFFDDAIRRKMEEKSRRELAVSYSRSGRLNVHTDIIVMKQDRLADSIRSRGITHDGITSIRVDDKLYALPDIYKRLTKSPTPEPRTLVSARSCECENPRGLNKAPSLEAFTARLDSSLKTSGIIGIAGVTKVTEVRAIDCDASMTDFFADASMDSVGIPEEMRASELRQLGATFVTTYNTLAYQSCDPKFRVVTSAVFTVDAPAADAFDGQRQLQRATRRFKFRIAVTGTCKLCKSDDLLFDEAYRRLLQSSYDHNVDLAGLLDSDSDRKLGYIVNNSTCFCDVKAQEVPQSPIAFTVQFNTSVTELISAGNITSIESIKNVVDLPPTQAPTLVPTVAPTVSPTAFPTFAPTQLPTAVPTTSPTLTPTQLPTAVPTAVPTLAPTTKSPTRRPTTSRPTRENVPSESPKPSPSPSSIPSSSSTM